MRNSVFKAVGVTMTLALIVAFAAPQDRRKGGGGGGGGQQQQRRDTPPPPSRGGGNSGGGQRREPPQRSQPDRNQGGSSRRDTPTRTFPGVPERPSNGDTGRRRDNPNRDTPNRDVPNRDNPGRQRPTNDNPTRQFPGVPERPGRTSGGNTDNPGRRPRPSDPGRNPDQVVPPGRGDRPGNGNTNPGRDVPGRGTNPGRGDNPGRGGNNGKPSDPIKPIPGRPVDPNGRPHPVPPRSGGNHSDGDHNIGRDRNNNTNINIRITRPGSISVGIQRRLNDQERVRLIVGGGWRNGYYGYNRGWRDNNFCYGGYIFDPWSYNRFVCSPWYYYSSLPPYLSYDRVIIINSGWYSRGWYGNPYRWNRPVYSVGFTWDNRYSAPDRNRYSDLDFAVDDLSRAFERQDYKAMDALCPQDGKVNMYFDGEYGYSLKSDDFYDVFADGIENVHTIRYDITNIRYNGRDSAKVTAVHEFTDPFGKRGTTYHDYFLNREGSKWVIREFGTSNAKTNW